MDYPTSITIGKHRYVVKQSDTIPGVCGYVDYRQKYINIAKRSSYTQRSYKREVVDDTFWHEVTHAILYEMDSPLFRNEKFVTKFSGLLTKAINSARF